MKRRGFTIVELLIVIVVIAILAAITIVAYNGVQQRANNTAIIDAASKSSRMIQAYIASTGNYPLVVTGNSCITTSSGCISSTGTSYGASGTFNTNMATAGTLPRSIPSAGTSRAGITYDYTAGRTYNGSAQPAILFYWLFGTSQSCGLTDVVTSFTVTVSSTTGYTAADDGGSGKTLCFIHIPGPSA